MLGEFYDDLEAMEQCAIAAGVWIMQNMEDEHRRRRSVRVMHLDLPLRVGVSFSAISSVYNDEKCTQAYHMSRKAFWKLLETCGEKLEKSASMGQRSGRCTISAEIRLAITLRMLSGARYLDLMSAYRVGESTVYDIFYDTCDILMSVLKLPGIPTDYTTLHELAAGFKYSRAFPNPLKGCIGALDGIAVWIKKPPNRFNPASFYCRKGYYALPVQKIVDSSYRFLYYSARCVGSTHDSLAFAATKLAKHLQEGGVFPEFWIYCDEAYGCTRFFIPPVPGSQTGIYEETFNVFLSSMRMHVEQAFGILVARWKIITGGLAFSLYDNTRIVCLCMKLHNFCIDNSDREVSVRSFNTQEKLQAEGDFQRLYSSGRTDLIGQRENGNHQTIAPMDTRKRDQLIRVIREKVLTRRQ